MGDKVDKMPAWPRKPVSLLGLSIDDPGYERARADAWEARARVAVEALSDIHERTRTDKDGVYHYMTWPDELATHAEAALITIGPLPDPTEGG